MFDINDFGKRGQLQNIANLKLSDMDKQTVYIGVMMHAESKSDLIFDVGPLLHPYFVNFQWKTYQFTTDF